MSSIANQSPTLGAHIHAHVHAHPCPWVLGGHGWAWVLCIPASNSKLESNFSDAGNTLTKKCSGLKPTTVNDFLFVRSNQDLVYAGNTHYTIFEYTSATWIAWLGTCHAMGGHRSLLMVMVWVWVQIRKKVLGFVANTTERAYVIIQGEKLIFAWISYNFGPRHPSREGIKASRSLGMRP
jgi:hypothetical protein